MMFKVYLHVYDQMFNQDLRYILGETYKANISSFLSAEHFQRVAIRRRWISYFSACFRNMLGVFPSFSINLIMISIQKTT